MSSVSGRTNRNERGSSYDRRRRRAWLVSAAAGFGGDGVKVPCWECGTMRSGITLSSVSIVPGSEGGTYRRSNIRGPHCTTCSCRQGQRMTAELARQADPYGDDDLCKACGVHWLDQHKPSCRYLVAGMV